MTDKDLATEVEARPPAVCMGCHQHPDELPEYVHGAASEGMTPEDFAWKEEGTMNRKNGHFLCTPCYLAAGCPVNPRVNDKPSRVRWVCP